MNLSRILKSCFVFLMVCLALGCAATSSTVIDPPEYSVKAPSSFVVEYTDMEFVLVPAGSFYMGSPEEEKNRDIDEGPVHKVEMSSFYMGKYEVTQSQWKKVMGKNPSFFKGSPSLPIENVSWDLVQKFMKVLNRKTGFNFRLPTEAEWEYACRAKVQARFSSGNDEKALREYAWFKDNSGEEPHQVGTLKPNNFGLYDMHGNVSEWIGDGRRGYLSDTIKDPIGGLSSKKAIHRGGCWLYPGRYCRSANRMDTEKNFRTHIIGFRLALDISAIDFNKHLK